MDTACFVTMHSSLTPIAASTSWGMPVVCRYMELAPVATYMLERLRKLASGPTLFYGLPLKERLIGDGHQRLCLMESQTLYLVSAACSALLLAGIMCLCR